MATKDPPSSFIERSKSAVRRGCESVKEGFEQIYDYIKKIDEETPGEGTVQIILLHAACGFIFNGLLAISVVYTSVIFPGEFPFTELIHTHLAIFYVVMFHILMALIIGNAAYITIIFYLMIIGKLSGIV